jgi:hypothetical protein
MAALAMSCAGAMNSDFGSPQDAGTLNGLPLDCELSDATCPGGGVCCGKMCCTVSQTCCMVNAQPTCVNGASASAVHSACDPNSTFGP